MPGMTDVAPAVDPVTFQTLGLTDWRYLMGRLEAGYACGSLGAAAALAVQVAGLADEHGVTPQLDLRPPGSLHLAVTDGVRFDPTEAEVAFARAVSDLARALGVEPEPSAAQVVEVAIDALDIAAIRPFWLAVLDYRPMGTHPEGSLVDPRGTGPMFWFQQMTEPRPQRNRIHLDVTVPHELAEQRVAAALAAGGRLVSDANARAWWVLADAEGNEVCICTWQDRN